MKKTTQHIFTAILALFSLSSQAQLSDYASVPYATGFESGTLDGNWYTSAATNGGRTQIWDSNTLTWSGMTAMAHTGNLWLGMDNDPGGSFITTESWMGLSMQGLSNYRLQFWWSEWNEETHPEDGLYISDDGGTSFTKVLDLNGPDYTDLQWYQFDMSLDSINTVHGLNFTSTYVVKFQQHDNYYFAGGNDGFLIDDISVYTTCLSGSVLNVTNCSYTVPSGDETYTVSGFYADTLTNAAMCDSIININFTSASPTSTLNEMSCGSYTVPSGDETYMASGTYLDTVPAAGGSCDSIITINLTVGAPSSSTIAPTSCGPYSAPDGQVFTVSGSYSATIPNVSGCDSLITINLSVGSEDSTAVTEVACDSFTWTNGTTYTTGGIYTQMLTNIAGCDSVATLDLTINASPIMTVASSDGVNLVSSFADSYIWVDCSNNSVVATSGNTYLAGTNGDYAVIGTLGGCSDTSDCFSVVNVGIYENDGVDLSVYPNPAKDLLFIKTDAHVSQLSIINSVGELIIQNVAISGPISLDKLSHGIYFLKITLDDGRQISRRFIKQ